MYHLCSKRRYNRSESSNIIDFGSNKKRMGHLFSRLIAILALFRSASEMRRVIGWKSQIFRTPSHLTPSIGVTFFEFLEKRYGSWNLSLLVKTLWSEIVRFWYNRKAWETHTETDGRPYDTRLAQRAAARKNKCTAAARAPYAVTDFWTKPISSSNHPSKY